MKVIAINGSPKKEGNTYHALQMVGNELQNEGIGFSILHIGNKMVHGCTACGKCAQNKDERCTLTTDSLNQWIQELKDADGIILGSPVYFSGIAGTMKCFLDRLFYVAGSNDGLFRHKVGASVVAVRRSGGSATFDSLNHYLHYAEMLIASANYWNIIHGAMPGQVEEDVEGIQTLRILGKKMAYLLNLQASNQGNIAVPEAEKKQFMNFIR